LRNRGKGKRGKTRTGDLIRGEEIRSSRKRWAKSVLSGGGRGRKKYSEESFSISFGRGEERSSKMG